MSAGIPKHMTLDSWNGSLRTQITSTSSPENILITFAFDTSRKIQGLLFISGQETLYNIPISTTIGYRTVAIAFVSPQEFQGDASFQSIDL